MQKKEPLSSEMQRARVTAVCAAISFGFCAFLVLMMLLFALTPDREQSQSENRMLAQKPVFTLSALADGSFMRDAESYLTDQFPLRDALVSFKSNLSLLLGKRELNGVYYGKKGFLLEKQTPLKPQVLEKTTDAMRAFAKTQKDSKNAVLISPNASYVLQDHMPYGLRQPDQKEILLSVQDTIESKRLSWIDCVGAFEKEEDPESLFYRTDHHWTTRGAFAAFWALNEAWELGAKKEDFVFYPVSDSFSGTLASSFGNRRLRDTVELCIPKHSRGRYAVLYEDLGEMKATMFCEEKLEQKNQYEVFLGGNYAKLVISSLADTDRTLLLFKDSYANCLIPMLTPFFSKIVVIDPRYYSDSLSSLLEETDFTHVLFLYNLNTFLEDQSLHGVLDS